jgi:superkiller protein 3
VAQAPAAGLSPQLLASVGSLLRDDTRLEEASWLRQAQAQHPADFWLNFDLGGALHESPVEAAGFYRVALAVRPGNSVVYNNLGNTLFWQKKLDEAITCYRKAVQADPKYAYAYYGLGQALKEKGLFDEAIACYRDAIEADPKYASPHIVLGKDFFYRQHKPDDAILCYRKAIEIDPKYANAHYGLGNVLLKQNKLDEAIAAYHKALKLKPNDTSVRHGVAWGLNNSAWALATHAEPARRNPGRAVSLAKEAIELVPPDGYLHNTLAVALYRAGRWKEAVATLENSMELPRASNVNSCNWFFRAMAHWQLGEKDKAREWYDKAIAWMDKNEPKNDELRRFRSEAAELLELNKKK